MRAGQRARLRQRDRDVVAITDKRDADALDAPLPLVDRLQVGQRLARVALVRERVDHRHAGVLRQIDQRLVGIRPCDDPVHVSAEHPRHVRDRLSLAQAHLALRQVDRVAAQALHADIEADARPQRRLLEEQRQRLPCQRVRIPFALQTRRRRQDDLKLIGAQVFDRDEVSATHAFPLFSVSIGSIASRRPLALLGPRCYSFIQIDHFNPVR